MRFGYALAAALGVGLMVVGCGAAEQPKAAPPPLPAPSRALVDWSQTVCTSAGTVDKLRGRIDSVNKDAADPAQAPFVGSEADSYLSGMDSDVGQPIQDLKALAPAGVSAADGYVRELVGKLSAVRAQLPQQQDITKLGDGQKLAKARQVAAVVATIPAQQPMLTGAISGSPKLIASYNLAPSCPTVPAPGKPAASSPDKAAVNWSDTMCTAEQSVAGLSSPPLVPAGGGETFAAMVVGQYVSGASGQVDRIQQEIQPLSDIGIKEADDYRASLLNSINAALSKLPQQSTGLEDANNLPADQLLVETKQVQTVLSSVKASGPDLSAIAAHNPRFAAAYNLAPSCKPPKATTTARNGADVGACQLGKCQIQVSKKVGITASGIKFSAEVKGATVYIVNDSGSTSMGDGGSGSFGKASGKTVDVHVADLRSGKAVLDISVS